jgi:putative flippase GtrA
MRLTGGVPQPWGSYPVSVGLHQGRSASNRGALRGLRAHAWRLTSFSVVGAFVFIAGLLFQVALVRYAGMGADLSYAAQAVFSIELSYVANRYVTWHGRESGFWTAAWKFNVQKLLMTVVNMTAYALLVHFGMQYVVANIVLTAIFTPVNYVASHVLVFVRSYRGRRRRARPDRSLMTAAQTGAGTALLPALLPSVSVVIPCKSSERTIRATVSALLGQRYPALKEIILVGDVNDSTFTAVSDIADGRLILREQERTPGKRDPNVKRDAGIRWSTGEVIALADSDIVMDADWLARAVGLLGTRGSDMVAGGMWSIHDSFWGRFVDSNLLAAKTPRLRAPYFVTADNFGKPGFKPPITANAVFYRELYDDCPLDVSWAYGYEDYEWMWRVAKAGHRVFFSAELSAAHHHRRTFLALVREYRRSAEGCARFIAAHGDSPLARRRRNQVLCVPLTALAAVAGVVAGIAMGAWEPAVLVVAVAGGALSCREAAFSRRWEAVLYPFPAAVLGVVFTQSLIAGLLRAAPAPEAVDADCRVTGAGPRLDYLPRKKGAHARMEPSRR